MFKISNFSICSSILLPSSLITLMIITISYLPGKLLIYISLGSYGFFFFFFWNLFLYCLICCFYFCVSHMLVTFPDLREAAFFRRCQAPRSTHLSGHQSYMLHEGLWALLLQQDGPYGQSGRCSWPCLLVCQALLWVETTGLWVAEPGHRAAGCRTLPACRSSAHCWVEPGSRVDGCRTRFPGSSVGLLVDRFSSIPKLIPACWWMGLSPWAAGWGF